MKEPKERQFDFEQAQRFRRQVAIDKMQLMIEHVNFKMKDFFWLALLTMTTILKLCVAVKSVALHATLRN